LGFRRLAVVDLSPEGRQPMHSRGGRYVIAFNGEVYNHAELGRELERLGHRFRGRSDTEVILAAVEQWGLVRSVERFVGMFAIALWDCRARRLSLVRDRLGIKPVYYGWMGRTFLCGSELKALRAHPAFRAEIDRGALTLFLRHDCVPAPHSIYRGVYKLPPGCILEVGASGNDRTAPTPYWSLKEVAEEGSRSPFTGSDEEAVGRLDGLLSEAVRLRMAADVPVGAFLSGGVDSSLVVALMAAQGPRALKTFTVGFREQEYDEAGYARAVARHLGTDHTELYVDHEDALEVIPRLPVMYDEPFADSSQVPTFLVSRLARRRVTVSLTGDGGDELFGGYRRYLGACQAWEKTARLPAWARTWLSRAYRLYRRGACAAWEKTAWLPAWARTWLSRAYRHSGLGAPLTRDSPEALYRQMVSRWQSPSKLVVGGYEPPTTFTDVGRLPRLPDLLSRLLYLDLVSYLPDDLLTKLDRASMAVGLEGRVPFLDHRLVAFACRLPPSLKVRQGQGKWVLRQVLYRYLPPALVDRPKMGFSIPLGEWLRGPLRDWGEALLDERRLRTGGFVDAALVRRRWAEHQSGQRGCHAQLWGVLMFQAWLEEWGRPAACPTRELVGGT
jgi:asparagine synthase (glutamine-hydrolysing)